MTSLPADQTSRRGLLVDEHLRLLGADGVFALGDCTGSSSLSLPLAPRNLLSFVIQPQTTHRQLKPLLSKESTSLEYSLN